MFDRDCQLKNPNRELPRGWRKSARGRMAACSRRILVDAERPRADGRALEFDGQKGDGRQRGRRGTGSPGTSDWLRRHDLL